MNAREEEEHEEEEDGIQSVINDSMLLSCLWCCSFTLLSHDTIQSKIKQQKDRERH